MKPLLKLLFPILLCYGLAKFGLSHKSLYVIMQK